MATDQDKQLEIALWKLSVLGPLVSARLDHGEQRAWILEIAERHHRRPDGVLVKLSPRTIEAWLYAYRRGSVGALERQRRADQGRTRAIGAELADVIVRAKREKPRRSIRRIIAMLERAGVAGPGELSRSSVHRLLVAHGISSRPVRGPAAERRSFLVEHAGDLWMGDAMHGPRVLAGDGQLRKSYLLTQIDAATRYIVHSYFALGEGAVEHEYGLKQAVLKAGRPRTYYVDLGAAYIASSLRLICAELAIHLVHTAPRDCEAKGAIERWHRSWREEVGDELAERALSISELNAVHWAWLGAEYHARRHTTTERAPREHWLAEAQRLRSVGPGINLDEVFLHRARRKVRKDGTVRFGGGLLEVRPELVGKTVELRYDPSQAEARPRVFVEGAFVCDTVELDLHRNAARHRRRNLAAPDPSCEPTGIDPLVLIEQEHYERTRAPRRLPRNDDDKED